MTGRDPERPVRADLVPQNPWLGEEEVRRDGGFPSGEAVPDCGLRVGHVPRHVTGVGGLNYYAFHCRSRPLERLCRWFVSFHTDRRRKCAERDHCLLNFLDPCAEFLRSIL